MQNTRIIRFAGSAKLVLNLGDEKIMHYLSILFFFCSISSSWRQFKVFFFEGFYFWQTPEIPLFRLRLVLPAALLTLKFEGNFRAVVENSLRKSYRWRHRMRTVHRTTSGRLLGERKEKKVLITCIIMTWCSIHNIVNTGSTGTETPHNVVISTDNGW